jgi:hypothetical protein
MKKFLIIIPVIIFTGIIIFFIVKSKQVVVEKPVDDVPTPEAVLPTVSGEVKVDIAAGNGKRSVDIKISGFPTDVETIEYELMYLTNSGLSRGVNGKRKVQDLPIKDITLGSCSTGGKCTYDEGVSSIDLVLKFNTAESSSIFRNTFPI